MEQYPDIIRCDKHNRHKITTKQWAYRPDHLFEKNAYMYDPSAVDYGMDPWYTIGDIDIDEHDEHDDYELYLDGCGLRIVSGDFPIYIHENVFDLMFKRPNNTSSSFTYFQVISKGLMVFPMWNCTVSDAIQLFDHVRLGNARNLAIMAVLPDQRLELNELDALEAAGLVVLQVPQDMQDPQDLLNFIENSIDDVDSMTESLSDLFHEPVELEETLLGLINDPNGE